MPSQKAPGRYLLRPAYDDDDGGKPVSSVVRRFIYTTAASKGDSLIPEGRSCYFITICIMQLFAWKGVPESFCSFLLWGSSLAEAGDVRSYYASSSEGTKKAALGSLLGLLMTKRNCIVSIIGNANTRTYVPQASTKHSSFFRDEDLFAHLLPRLSPRDMTSPSSLVSVDVCRCRFK